jgi:large subunit ribosomal protein L5
MIQRLELYYRNYVSPSLQNEFSYANYHAIPTIKKITINRGVGEASGNGKLLEQSLLEIETIVGQSAVITRSKKAIAGFKLRPNAAVGMYTTLRGNKMYAFLDRLINLALPRIRDFQGLNRSSFDQNGNYTIGVSEQLMFPEIEFENVQDIRGLDISITTTAKTDYEAFVLLSGLGLPFSLKKVYN